MKQIVQNYRTGELSVLEVPRPACQPGGVLIRTAFSLISTGTEMMKVTEARLSLLGKARARPDQVRKVMDSVVQQGPAAAFEKAMNKLDSLTPLGYSMAGVVVAVGEGVEEFAIGDRVAGAGNEFALHAEFNWVPVNLCVKVPDAVALEHAAFGTVGAIALHGVRQGSVQLGETACVIGLGLIGQLVVRLLVAAGVRVVGIDTVKERCDLAEAAGALACSTPDADGLARVEQAILQCSQAIGADHVFITAGGDSGEPARVAARVIRDRGRVVDIGKTRLDLPWNAYYEKELDLRMSRSYGPGRYDAEYELRGHDYPPSYVRWTERRNIICFLDLLASNDLDVSQLLSGTFPVEDAVPVYGRIGSGELKGVGFVFSYGSEQGEPAQESPQQVVPNVTTQARSGPAGGQAGPNNALRVGFVGAGNYASSMLLPYLAKDPRVALQAVATISSLSAANAQQKFGFARSTTRWEDVLEDEDISAVFVVTRHHSHAEFVARALTAGKAVFVEKPLALSHAQLQDVLAAVAATRNDRLMVGFNRRFAPLFVGMRSRFGPAHAPMLMRYLVNAGRLDRNSWYLNTQLEGSRFVGEGGHFIDTLGAFVGADAEQVTALQTGDGNSLQVSLTYPDGSLGTIVYATSGHQRFPKETIDVTGGGRNARLDNFARYKVWRASGGGTGRSLRGPNKGQEDELKAFLSAVVTGAPMPIPLSCLAATTRATLAVPESLSSGLPVRI